MSDQDSEGSASLFPVPLNLQNEIRRMQLLGTIQSGQPANYNRENGVETSNGFPTGPVSVINISQTCGVVIGSQIQFQGPVTYHQYINTNGITEALRNLPPPKSLICYGKHISNWIIWTILLAICLGLGIYCILILTSKTSTSTDSKITIDDDKTSQSSGSNWDGEIPDLGNGHLLYSRKQWGGVKVIKEIDEALKQPIDFIMITHVGYQIEPCENLNSCSMAMRSYQEKAIVTRNLTHLTANFYIGGDSKIYEGRSWNVSNGYNAVTLAICFVGDYSRFYPKPAQFEALFRLLEYGVELKHISPDYKIIAHRQTQKTRSPGDYIFREMTRWPHYDSCITIKAAEQYCGKELGYTLNDWRSKITAFVES